MCSTMGHRIARAWPQPRPPLQPHHLRGQPRQPPLAATATITPVTTPTMMPTPAARPMSFGRLTALLLGDHCNDPAPMLASAQCTNALSESNVHCTRTLDRVPGHYWPSDGFGLTQFRSNAFVRTRQREQGHRVLMMGCVLQSSVLCATLNPTSVYSRRQHRSYALQTTCIPDRAGNAATSPYTPTTLVTLLSSTCLRDRPSRQGDQRPAPRPSHSHTVSLPPRAGCRRAARRR